MRLTVNSIDTIEVSSPLMPSTPSLGSSGQEEVDELLLESPPGISYVQDLLNAQMGMRTFLNKYKD